MRIAIDTRFLEKNTPVGYEQFLLKLFTRLAEQLPAHQFIFITDQPAATAIKHPANIKLLQVRPVAKGPLSWKWWYEVKLPAILRREQAALLIAASGFCSLRATVPQYLFVNNVSFLQHPGLYKKSFLQFYSKNLPRFLKKATAVITFSQATQKEILQHFKAATGKVEIIHGAAGELFKPAGDEEKQAVKAEFAKGKEFFLHTGEAQSQKDLLLLLKAFSLFKKRQQSSMKLLLTGSGVLADKKFNHSLKTYKYRDDVVCTGYLPAKTYASLVAAAYALVYISQPGGFGMPVMEALQSRVPAIVPAGWALKELPADTFLRANMEEKEQLAELLMRIYKDENLRNRLIKSGESITWDLQQATDQLIQLISKAHTTALV
jgi:glycosyltransferase involved in cell wall biosynthesis